MSELPVPAVARPVPAVAPAPVPVPALGAVAPTGGQSDVTALFLFMRDAERRFQTLRMTIMDRRVEARGETFARTNAWIRHPGDSRIVVGEHEGPVRGGYHVWVGNGTTVSHYDADANVVRSRPRLAVPRGSATDPDLPTFGRVYEPVTPLPAGSLVDTFVHPHGFCRNVLSTGRLSMQGTASGAAGREMQLVRCDHPRSTKVLTDRPDHWILVGVDRTTGLILLLEEHVGDVTTRRAEVTALALDEPLGDEVFELHVSGDVRRLY
jgi:hypothetical protein